MNKRSPFVLLVLLFSVLAFSALQVDAETYTNTKTFDSDQGIFWNYSWNQCLADLPPDAGLDSVEVELRAKVWAWGFYPNPARVDLLVSDTTQFYAGNPDYTVCSLTSGTYPSPSNFYTVTCPLKANQIEWLINDKCLNFIMVSNGATYYLDYAVVRAQTAVNQVAVPTFSPKPGVYTQELAVSITSETEGASITYTSDGSPPTETSTPYTGLVEISATTTLKAGAFKTGWTPSEVATGTFIVDKGNETALYLRDKGVLSEEMGSPIPWVTRYVNPQDDARSAQWQTTLKGDISGEFFYNIDIVECEAPATLKVEFIVDQDGISTTVAIQEISIDQLPQGYYAPKSANISGVDLETQEGDFLTFRVTLTSGPKRVGVGLDGTADYNDSQVKVFYNGPVPCFTVTPQKGSLDTLFSFNASCSSDNAYPTSGLEVRWDWENDGVYDTAFSANKVANHRYSSSGIKNVKLQVRNPDSFIRSKVGQVSVVLSILASLDSPGAAPVGLAWDGTHVWVSDTYTNTIYRLTTSGEVVSSFSSPCGDPFDLAWDGQFLWVVDAWGSDGLGNILYKVDTSGNVLKSLEVPRDISTGLTWDGHFLWGADGTNNIIFKIDPETGEVLASFSAPGPSPRGLAWDGQHLWVAEFTNQEIYQIDANGKVLNTYPSPGTAPMGLTWDGVNLWCVDLDSLKIYNLAVPGGTTSSTITCDLSTQDIILGDRLTVSGLISPAPGEAGIGVSIEFISPDGNPVYRASLANIIGEFSYPIACEDFDRAGTWQVRTSWAGRGIYESSTSPAAVVQVAAATTSLTLNATSQAIKFGEPVDLSGKFTPQPECGGNISGIPIELHISGPGGRSDVQATVTADRWGHYVLQDYNGLDAIGDWSVQATFGGSEAYLGSSSDSLNIKVVETAGYGIVVQGRISGEEGLDSHSKTAGFAYAQLKSRGLQDEDIKYFNYDVSLPGVDGVPSKHAVGDAITNWASEQMNANPANLYIVMVDHGFNEMFYIHPDTISAADFGAWLDNLQGSLTGQAAEQEIILILGFCRSGSFVDNLSGYRRVVITSAAANESSYKGPLDEDGIRDGEYFVTEFFKRVSYGNSVRKCFEEATALTEQFTASGTGEVNAPFYDDSRQHPLLDDNGDGLGSNDLSDPAGDGQLSENLFVGVSKLTGNDPEDVRITQMTPSVFLGETQSAADLWAKVDNNARLDTIWIEIKPPGYMPADAGGTGQVKMELIRSAYQTYNEDEDRYEWLSQGGFEIPGAYQVFYFAKDRNTKNVSPLRETRVYKAKAGNTPPAVFALLSPDDRAEVLTTVVLDWEDAFDSEGDPMNYTVLLSKGDPGFWEPIRIEDLRYSTCLVGPADGIEDLSEYYWKVQAIDRYGAIRETDARVFHTNNTNPVTAWVRGHVYDAGTMESITDAVVSIGGVALNTALGGYYLGEIPPGTYGMTASANGYNVGSYSSVALGQGALVTKNFALVPSGTSYPGDIDGNGRVDLGDAILSLKALSGLGTIGLIRPDYPDTGADVDGDKKIGLAEVVYIMQEISGTR